MERTEVEDFRARLLEERSRLEQDAERADAARREVLSPAGEGSSVRTHDADRDVEGLEERITSEETVRARIRSIDDALARIEEGGYGTCARCSQPIPIERLEELPQATHCVECQRALEAERGAPPNAPLA